MLELKDFLHLPQLDPLIEQLAADGPGLILIAGLDLRPLAAAPEAATFLPSGRPAIFRILMRHILEARPRTRALVVAQDKDLVRLPRDLKRRVDHVPVRSPDDYADRIAAAAHRRPGLLVIDQIGPESAAAALEAAQPGLRVLSQMDTIFRGSDVARALLDLGAPQTHLNGLRWVIAVQRLAMLCSHCKEPLPAAPAPLRELLNRYPDLAAKQDIAFLGAAGCSHCHQSGRWGEVTAFDVFHAAAGGETLFSQPSLLSMEEYVLRLVAEGYLAPDDAVRLESDQLRHTYNLLTASERALSQANRALERKLVELEAANRVLGQRTEALLSLQDVGQALISAVSLEDLASRVCRHTRELCGADRVVLYYLRSQDTAEVLAVSGWNPAQITGEVDASLIGGTGGAEPSTYNQQPPGIAAEPAAIGALRAGLRVPLVAQGQPVGALIVHTTQKSTFAPGEVALLQTVAHQAALALQRAGLIKTLRQKIAELEAAQAELVKKERLEQELELARQVQQSMLPRIFPMIPGYTFAARNQPARRVGGDFYDVILLDADRFGLVIGDVSDKGMPSALYMALTRSLILAEARRERSPAAVLRSVHHLLLALGEANMFVTAFYGVVDGSSRQLTYARAGHDLPLLLRDGGVQRLGGSGTVLGFPDLDEMPLAEERLELHPGDRLVLYTDGLTDALDENDRFFGLERLMILLRSHADLSPYELCQTIFAALAAYQGTAEPFDDMTMLVVEVK
ncbi:MAG TPA: SpoIIE family protein phosphatase [Anaerolineae bacterium]